MKKTLTLKNHRILSDLGLTPCKALQRDVLFWLALVAGIVVVLLLRLFMPETPGTGGSQSLFVLFNVLVWYPLLEELFFRGVIQGQLLHTRWARSTFAWFSYANWVSSLLFVAFHFIYHPPLWALSVMAPSLVFGYFRDKYTSILPGLLLHIVYNLEYVIILS